VPKAVLSEHLVVIVPACHFRTGDVQVDDPNAMIDTFAIPPKHLLVERICLKQEFNAHMPILNQTPSFYQAELSATNLLGIITTS
jgi:hypothetical protein